MKTGSKGTSVDLGVVNEKGNTSGETDPGVILEVFEDSDEVVANAPKAPDGAVVVEDRDDIATLPRGAVENADRSVTVTLDDPVVFHLKDQRTGILKPVRYDELRFHRLNGKHTTEIAMATDATRMKVAFACSLRVRTGVAGGIFDTMDSADGERCGKVIEYFFGSGRKTGRR